MALTCAYVTSPVTVAALGRPAVLTILTPSQSQEISGHVSFWAGDRHCRRRRLAALSGGRPELR